eukprot:EC790658.1.p1 GENE.EC790658.1~~EC790658.1.p1  ORF type:complete len:176 (+),score=11.43 EC790658.1:45-572(+)
MDSAAFADSSTPTPEAPTSLNDDEPHMAVLDTVLPANQCTLCRGALRDTSRVNSVWYRCLVSAGWFACEECEAKTRHAHPLIKFRREPPASILMGCDMTPLEHAAICDACGAPIIGTRYRCSTCSDFDLCAECELFGDHPHPRDHVFYKVLVPFTAAYVQTGQVAPSEAWRQELK